MAKKLKKYKVGCDSETYAISMVEMPAIESNFVALAKEEEEKAKEILLCEEIDGIGFERADSMAMKLGLERDSYARLVSGVAHVLKYNAAQNGHVCLPREKLVQASSHLLGANAERVDLDVKISRGLSELLGIDYDTIYAIFNEGGYRPFEE